MFSRVLPAVFSCLAGVVVFAHILVGSSSSTLAGDDSGMGTSYYAGLNCAQLWYERNAIFASRGYCFKSRRGIAAFGRRCYAPYGKLPSNLKSVVREIRSWEKQKRC